MAKTAAAANVVDLEAFRQRKMLRGERANESPMPVAHEAAVMMPVWFCWVPVWAPVLT